MESGRFVNSEGRLWKPREEWPPGPWDDEPDWATWINEETGLHCFMRRNGMGAWCGYVGVPRGHSLCGVDYMDVDVPWIKVHGGLTYGEWEETPLAYGALALGRMAPLWIFGFDCAHSCDAFPMKWWEHGTYRTFDYVKAETESLARQLAERR